MLPDFRMAQADTVSYGIIRGRRDTCSERTVPNPNILLPRKIVRYPARDIPDVALTPLD